MDAELSFSVADTSLDPYIRAFNPQLSPYTTAVASGNVRVVGELANIDELLVEATVERLDLRLFDYRLRNADADPPGARSPHRRASPRCAWSARRRSSMSTGMIDLHDERIAMRATGDANLGILQGFVPNIRSSGRASLQATLEGPMRDPIVSGTMNVDNGRIRHFDLPHALENIPAPLRFDYARRRARRGDRAARRRRRSGSAAGSTSRATGPAGSTSR